MKLKKNKGYAYDYQQDLAAYTGWKYEYVEGSWPELMQMLKDGEIDLLSDVSITPEREMKCCFLHIQWVQRATICMSAIWIPGLTKQIIPHLRENGSEMDSGPWNGQSRISG